MFELPPSSFELLEEYTGEKGFIDQLETMEDRELGDGSHLQFTDQNCDTSLFPYQAEGPLPAPIPTPAEILAAKPAEWGRAWRVGPYMVKAGFVNVFQEAENMLYLERNSTVRTAKVYAAFASADASPWPEKATDTEDSDGANKRTNCFYLVTEFLDGEMLNCVSENEGGSRLNVRILRKIGAMLGEQLRRLRSVSPPEGTRFGRINNREFGRILPLSKPIDPQTKDWGPFNYEDFVARVMHASMFDLAVSDPTPNEYQPPPFGPLQRMMFSDAKYALLDITRPSDRTPVLSHLDVHASNVILKTVRDEKGTLVDVEEVILIDWEWMSWVPPWFEAGDLLAGMHRGYEDTRSVSRLALGTMGRVNMLITAFWGFGIQYAHFRTATI